MWELRSVAAGTILGLAIFVAGAATGQVLEGCAETLLPDPPRLVFECAGGLVIEAELLADETGTSGIVESSGTGFDLSERGVLIQIAPTDEPFQVLTPHAIASVRGTEFSVDVSADVTSVFVFEGRVDVRARTGDSSVELGAGDGVDVTPGQALQVVRWPRERVDALRARFGR